MPSTRRDFLKQGAVAGGAVWAVPKITSLPIAQGNVGTPVAICGWMTGGGVQFLDGPGRDHVTYGFRLECSTADGPNQLQINWGPGKSFHMDQMTSAICSDSPDIEPPPPAADFDTHTGTGTGTYKAKGKSQQANVAWEIRDAGEPGGANAGGQDSIFFKVTSTSGEQLFVLGPIFGGNNQAHRCH